MTITLPEDIPLFRPAFDSVCKRILESESDLTFYELLYRLIVCLSEHPLLKGYILDLEGVSEKQKQEVNSFSLEALEDLWKRFWRYHRHILKQRKKLVRIKRMITKPGDFSLAHLYFHIFFAMRDFSDQSPFCRFISNGLRFFEAAVSEQELASTRLLHLFPAGKKYFAQRKVSSQKLNKKSKLCHLYQKVCNFELEGFKPFKWTVELATSAFVSPKIEEREKRFSIPGRNSIEKRKTMQMMAETNPVFCWERLRFFSKCYVFNNRGLVLKPIYGRWTSIRQAAWQSAVERNEKEMLFGANMALRQQLSATTFSSIDPFVPVENQFQRKDTEKCLQALQYHIHDQLFIIESQAKSIVENSQLSLPGTQKWNFAVDLTSKYWKINPLANHDEAFKDYAAKCPAGKLLSRTRWDQIVRERHLDPRPNGAKKRGKGKKDLSKLTSH